MHPWAHSKTNAHAPPPPPPMIVDLINQTATADNHNHKRTAEQHQQQQRQHQQTHKPPHYQQHQNDAKTAWTAKDKLRQEDKEKASPTRSSPRTARTFSRGTDTKQNAVVHGQQRGRKTKCSVCGEVGHNARRHRKTTVNGLTMRRDSPNSASGSRRRGISRAAISKKGWETRRRRMAADAAEAAAAARDDGEQHTVARTAGKAAAPNNGENEEQSMPSTPLIWGKRRTRTQGDGTAASTAQHASAAKRKRKRVELSAQSEDKAGKKKKKKRIIVRQETSSTSSQGSETSEKKKKKKKARVEKVASETPEEGKERNGTSIKKRKLKKKRNLRKRKKAQQDFVSSFSLSDDDDSGHGKASTKKARTKRQKVMSARGEDPLSVDTATDEVTKAKSAVSPLSATVSGISGADNNSMIVDDDASRKVDATQPVQKGSKQRKKVEDPLELVAPIDLGPEDAFDPVFDRPVVAESNNLTLRRARFHTAPCAPTHTKKTCLTPNCVHNLGGMCDGAGIWHADERAIKVGGVGPDPALSSRKPGTPVGLANLGATCYMNAFLQSLFFNETFRSTLELFDGGNEIVNELQTVFAFLRGSTRASYTPKKFVTAMSLKADEQQDVQEFGSLMLSYVENVLAKASEGSAAGFGYTSRVRTLVPDLFRGVTAYITTCDTCGHESRVPSHFYELMLSIQGNKHVRDCFANYVAKEHLSGDNCYMCNKCKSKQPATRGQCLTKAPPFLLLQLTRFVFDYELMQKQKVKDNVFIPAKLDVREFMDVGSSSDAGGSHSINEDDARFEYELCAVLNHMGTSAHYGHYVANVLDEQSGLWWSCNDDVVSVFEGMTPGGEKLSKKKSGAAKRGGKKRKSREEAKSNVANDNNSSDCDDGDNSGSGGGGETNNVKEQIQCVLPLDFSSLMALAAPAESNVRRSVASGSAIAATENGEKGKEMGQKSENAYMLVYVSKVALAETRMRWDADVQAAAGAKMNDDDHGAAGAAPPPIVLPEMAVRRKELVDADNIAFEESKSQWQERCLEVVRAAQERKKAVQQFLDVCQVKPMAAPLCPPSLLADGMEGRATLHGVFVDGDDKAKSQNGFIGSGFAEDERAMLVPAKWLTRWVLGESFAPPKSAAVLDAEEESLCVALRDSLVDGSEKGRKDSKGAPVGADGGNAVVEKAKPGQGEKPRVPPFRLPCPGRLSVAMESLKCAHGGVNPLSCELVKRVSRAGMDVLLQNDAVERVWANSSIAEKAASAPASETDIPIIDIPTLFSDSDICRRCMFEYETSILEKMERVRRFEYLKRVINSKEREEFGDLAALPTRDEDFSNGDMLVAKPSFMSMRRILHTNNLKRLQSFVSGELGFREKLVAVYKGSYKGREDPSSVDPPSIRSAPRWLANCGPEVNVNSRLLCEHQRRAVRAACDTVRVSSAVWSAILACFPRSVSINVRTKECKTCLSQRNEKKQTLVAAAASHQEVMDNIVSFVRETRLFVSSACTPRPGVYYAVPYKWRMLFNAYCDDSDALPGPIPTSDLLCEHALFAYYVFPVDNEETLHLCDDPDVDACMSLVPEHEWPYLKSKFGVSGKFDDTVKITVTLSTEANGSEREEVMDDGSDDDEGMNEDDDGVAGGSVSDDDQASESGSDGNREDDAFEPPQGKRQPVVSASSDEKKTVIMIDVTPPFSNDEKNAAPAAAMQAAERTPELENSASVAVVGERVGGVGEAVLTGIEVLGERHQAKSSRMRSSKKRSSRNVYVIESIDSKRIRRGKVEYRVQWEGYAQKNWVSEDNIIERELVDVFEAEEERKEKERAKLIEEKLLQKEAEKEAEKGAKKARKEAERAAMRAEKSALRAAKKAEREASRAAKKKRSALDSEGVATSEIVKKKRRRPVSIFFKNASWQSIAINTEPMVCGKCAIDRRERDLKRLLHFQNVVLDVHILRESDGFPEKTPPVRSVATKKRAPGRRIEVPQCSSSDQLYMLNMRIVQAASTARRQLDMQSLVLWSEGQELIDGPGKHTLADFGISRHSVIFCKEIDGAEEAIEAAAAAEAGAKRRKRKRVVSDTSGSSPGSYSEDKTGNVSEESQSPAKAPVRRSRNSVRAAAARRAGRESAVRHFMTMSTVIAQEDGFRGSALLSGDQ